MSNRETLKDTPSTISLPASEAGALPPGERGGPTTSRSGRQAARASRSRSMEKEPVLTTSGICGPTSFASSVPAGPLSSWESRLRERLAMVGSTESALIWREKATPAGASISRLAPWTPPTSASGFIGSPWATPTLCGNDNRKGASPTSGDGICTQMRQTWSTPRASDGKKGGPNMTFGAGGQPLPAQMHQSPWPTPTVADVTGGRKHRSGARSSEMLLNGLMATWVTPSARDYKDSAGMNLERPDGRTRIDLVPRQMIATAAATWPTPTSLSGGSETSNPPGNSRSMNKTLEYLYGPDRGMNLSGQTTSGSSATTGKRGAPNPAFPCWLMGYPAEWLLGAVSATQLVRLLQRKSSKRS